SGLPTYSKNPINSSLRVRMKKSRRTLVGRGYPQDFFDRDDPFLETQQTGLPQRHHAETHGLALDFGRRRSVEHELAQLLAHRHHFAHSDSALVAGPGALVAALALLHLHQTGFCRRKAEIDQNLGVHLDLFGTVRADSPGKTLRQDEVD